MKTNPGTTLLKPAKPPDSNYESPALTAELQARLNSGFKHHLVKPIDLNKLDLLIQEGAAALPGKSAVQTPNRGG